VIDDPAAVVDPSARLQDASPDVALAPPVEEFARPLGAPISNRRRWWRASLALAVLITAGGFALVYNDDLSFQSADRALTTQNESLQGQNLGLQGQLSALQANLAKTQSDLARAQSDLAKALAHPDLGIWNVIQTVQGPSYYLAAGVPDTFTYHLGLKSNGPMNVSIVSFEQFSAAVTCIDNGAGSTNYCMHHSGAAVSWLGVTSVNYDFHLAEGCAAYMVVITAPSKVTITPDVRVTYNPAPHATGTCA
jgi:hypothetical protein